MNLSKPQRPRLRWIADPERTGARASRRLDAACESLEGKQLLSAAAGALDPTAQVHMDVRQLKQDLRALERHSHVTPTEFMAFERDEYDVLDSPLDLVSPNDPGVISLEVSSGNLVDSAFFDGSLDAQGWANVTTQLENNLNLLAYSPTQVSVSQIVTDMQQIAHSAGVNSNQAQVVYADVANLYTDEMKPGAPATPEPWSQVILPSLRGFVHGKG